jgi:hypothetical protein
MAIASLIEREVMAAIVKLSEAGELNQETYPQIFMSLARSAKGALEIRDFLINKIKEFAGCLMCVSRGTTLILRATDGKDRFNQCDKLFSAGIDADLEAFGLNHFTHPIEETEVTVHEMFRSGNFREIVGGRTECMDALCLTPSQGIQFVKMFPKWLASDKEVERGTFFMMKAGGEYYMVMVTVLPDRRLKVNVGMFNHTEIWDHKRGHRFVLPAVK